MYNNVAGIKSFLKLLRHNELICTKMSKVNSKNLFKIKYTVYFK